MTRRIENIVAEVSDAFAVSTYDPSRRGEASSAAAEFASIVADTGRKGSHVGMVVRDGVPVWLAYGGKMYPVGKAG